MRMRNVEEILRGFIGKELNTEDIITELNLEENIIINEVEGYITNFDGHGQCGLWELELEDTEEEYKIFVDVDNIIVEIK